MSKVIKGIGIAAVAFFAPVAVAFFSAAGLSAGVISALNYIGFSALLSGVAAQLASNKRPPTPSQTINYSGTVESRRIIYGETRTGGMEVIPPVTSGTNNARLHQVLAIAGHEVTAIPTVYFNQDTVGTIGSVTGTANDGLVSSGTYANKAWVRRYLGTSTQTADFILDNALSIWTTDHRGRGVAYVAIQYQYDDAVYKSGKPQPNFLVQGKKVYDPRKDSTNGGSGSHRLNNAATWEYSSNPALCLADYITDASLGMGEDQSRIDWAMVATAAAECDEAVSIPGGGTQNRYTFNGVLYAAAAYEDNINALVGAMLGICIYSGGKWRISAGSWPLTSEFEITEATLVDEGVDVVTAIPYNERYNSVRGSFIDSNNNYQANEFPAVSSATYVSADGETVWRDIRLDHCTNVFEAQRSAIILTRKSRNRQSATFRCNMSAWRIRPGEVGIVSIAELGWTNKTVRCEGWRFNHAGYVEISVREEASSDWTDPLTTDYTSPLNIANPTPVAFTPDAPSGLTATTAENGVALRWTAPSLFPIGARYQLFEHSSASPFSSASLIWEGLATETFIARTDQVARYYWVRVIMPDGTTSAAHPTGNGVSGVAVGLALTGSLTRPSVTLAATSAGVVSDFSPAAGSFVIRLGSVDISTGYSVSYAVGSATGATATINATTGAYSVSAMSADTATVVFTATYSGYTISQALSLSKARAGTAGADGASPITVSLSKTSATVVDRGDGTVLDWAPATGRLYVYQGTNDVTGSATLSSTATNATGAINTATDTPKAGQPKGYYEITALSAEFGFLTLSATYNGVTVSQQFQVSKVKQGFEIVGALPSTGLYEGRVVLLTTDDKLYRYTGTAWTTAVPSTDITGQLTNSQIADLAATKLTGQITTTQITDEAISTPKLASGSVIAGKLAAGSVITSKLLVVPVSLCPDPYFDDTAWWTATVYDANGWFFENGGDLGTKRRATLWSGASTPPGTNRKHVWSDYIAPPAPGTSIRLRARAINDSNQDCYITVRFSTAAETDIGDVTLLIPKTIGYSATNLTIIGTVPANAARMRFIIYNEAGTTFTGIVFIGGIMLDVAASADLIVDGAVVADKLAANSVTSNKILAGSITAAKISVGAQSENLILNPGAEGNSTEAWAVVEQASGTGTVAASTAQRYSGDYSFRLASNGQYAAGHRAIPVVPGDVYTFRVRVKGSSSAANGLYLRMNEGASAPAKGFYGTDIDTANLRASLTDFVSNVAVPSAWTTYSFKYTVPSGVYWVTPSVYNWSSGVDVFFDDVEFRRTMDASYIANLDADVISAGTIKASKIELNGISTDRIALTAASASAAVSTSGTYNHTGWTTRGSVSYTPNDTDSRLAIYFGAVITQGDAAVGTCTTEARLLRAGTVIWGPTPVCRVKAIPTPFSSFVTQTSLSGASTYELQFQANVSSGSGDPHSVEQARILVVEFKR